MTHISINTENLQQLHTYLNNGEDHSDPTLSAQALLKIREMPQPCPRATKADIKGVGACVGDNSSFDETITVSCEEAIEQPNRRWEKKKPTLCSSGGDCIMCLPKTRKGGTAMIIIS